MEHCRDSNKPEKELLLFCSSNFKYLQECPSAACSAFTHFAPSGGADSGPGEIPGQEAVIV